jgi:hypothetical protein
LFHGQTEVGRSLIDDRLRGDGANGLDHLHPRSTSPDDRDFLVLELDALFRPVLESTSALQILQTVRVLANLPHYGAWPP